MNVRPGGSGEGSGPHAPCPLLCAALVVVLAWPGAAWPQAPREPTTPPNEGAPPATTPEAVPPPPAPPPVPAPTPEAWTWLDSSHRFLSHGFLWATLRFDRFFADERDVDLPRTSSFLRWRNTVSLRDDGRRSYAPDVRVDVVLPNLDRRLDQLRLRLTVVTTRSEAVDPLLPRAVRPPDIPNRPHAGLVVSTLRPLRWHTDLQTGALFRRPLGWYGRARLRRVQPVGELIVVRLALAGFWQTDLRFGTRQELSIEHPFTSWLLLRLAGNAMVAERSHGWEWSSELALLAASWPRSALSASVTALGASRAGPGAEAWRLQVRARHDVFRRWIFLEVNPECVWSRAAGARLHRAAAAIVRLEVQFEASSDPTQGEQGRPGAEGGREGEPPPPPPR